MPDHVDASIPFADFPAVDRSVFITAQVEVIRKGDRALERNVRGANGAAKLGQAQHPFCLPDCWIGGQGLVPYEQYTQQSPASGLSTTWHCVHS